MSIFHAAFGINPTTELQDPHIISLSPLKGAVNVIFPGRKQKNS